MKAPNTTVSSGSEGTTRATPTERSSPTTSWGTGSADARGGELDGHRERIRRWDFEVGPVTLHDAGEWRVRSTAGETRAHSTQSHRIVYQVCGDDHEEPSKDQPPAWPANLEAHAQQNEDIRLGWNASDDADTYHVYRSTEDGGFEPLAEVDDTAFTDTEIEAETAHTYEVTAANDAGEAEDCEVAEVTAIPFFPGPALVAMAANDNAGVVSAERIRRD